MLNVKIYVTGTLKEQYYKDAIAEYKKRLGAFCKFEIVEFKEYKLPDDPSQKQIEGALAAEGQKILSEISPKAYKIAMCVEGKQLSSERLASKIEDISNTHSEICFVIGSSHGLSEEVKSRCDMRLSVSEMTFPHQLLRVILLEGVYRAFNIIAGTRYHK